MEMHKRELWDNRPDSKIILGIKNCVFCINTGEQKQYIIKESKYWSIRYNKYPYYGNKEHLLAMPKKHKEFTDELSIEEIKDYKNIELFMKEYYKGKDYYSFIRQSMGGRSLKHLHYHYLTGKLSFREINGDNFFKIKNN